MIESTENIWKYYRVPDHLVCITTNGFVKANGEAVMGRGCAREAAEFIPHMRKLLGGYIKERGNVPGLIQTEPDEYGLYIFPVKHNWWEPADLDLIRTGVTELRKEALNNSDMVFHLPRPGCGNGNRDWEIEVAPLCSILPENVWIHSKEVKKTQYDLFVRQ